MPTTYKKLQRKINNVNYPVQVQSAIEDGDGVNIKDKYAKKDGYYDTFGFAQKSLLTDNFDTKMVLTDNSGYLFRTTGGSLEVGEQNRVKKIIGASVPIVQQVQNGNFANGTTNWSGNSFGSSTISASNGVLTVAFNQGTYVNAKVTTSLQSGHKVAVMFDGRAMTNSGGYIVRVGGSAYTDVNVSFTTTFNRFGFIVPVSDNNGGIDFYKYTENSNRDFQLRNVVAIDLSATFGTTVANRLYALEQAQAGSGIAKAKEILVKDYYPYNVTAFTHTKTSGKVNNGFNQFNLPALLTQIGDPITAVTNAHLNNKIIFNNSELKYQGRVCVTKSGIVRNAGSANVVTQFVYTDGTSAYGAPIETNGYEKSANGKVVRRIVLVYSNPGSYNFTNAKMCVSLSWDSERDGEYEDYQEWSYPTEDRELKGILSLNAQDNWVADGDEYLPSGVVDVKRASYTCGATEPVAKDAISGQTTTRFYLADNTIFNSIVKGTTLALCSKLVCLGDYSTAYSSDNVGFYVADNGRIFIKLNVSTIAEAQTFLNGAVFEYPLATPTQSSADSYTELQNDSNWGAEKWIDNRDVPLPVFSTCEYIPDLKAKEEVAPESPEEDGDYIMHRENGINTYGSLSTWLSANGYNKWTAVDLADIGTMTVTTIAANALYKVDIAVVNDIGEGHVVVSIGNNTYWAINKNGEALVVFADEDLTGETIDYVAILS